MLIVTNKVVFFSTLPPLGKKTARKTFRRRTDPESGNCGDCLGYTIFFPKERARDPNRYRKRLNKFSIFITRNTTETWWTAGSEIFLVTKSYRTLYMVDAVAALEIEKKNNKRTSS